MDDVISSRWGASPRIGTPIDGYQSAGTNEKQEPEGYAEHLRSPRPSFLFPPPRGPGRQSRIRRVDLLRVLFGSAFVGMMFSHEPVTPALDVHVHEAAVFGQPEQSRVLEELSVRVMLSHGR